MIIKYQIFPLDRLLIIKASGDFDIEYYTQFAKLLVLETDWQHVEKVITDIRGLDVDYKKIPVNISIVSQIRRGILKNDYLNVFVVNTPMATAIAHIYQDILKQDDFKYEYHSTIKETIKTLDLSLKEEFLDQCLSNLQNTFLVTK